MTFNPPPPPPSQGPPPPPPPPSGQPHGQTAGWTQGQQQGQQQAGGPPPQWGPPPGATARQPRVNSLAGFDPKTVNPLDWVIMGAGLLTFIFSFLDYYTASVTVGRFTAHGAESAWHGFFGWFAALLALIAAGAVAVDVFTPHVQLPAPPRLIGLGILAVALLFIIIAAFVTPGVPSGVNVGRGVGFWLDLILVLVAIVASLMRFQQTGGTLPGPLANIPNIGARGPQGGLGGTTAQRDAATPPPPPPPGGYNPPPPPGGYNPPPPPGGYNPPPPPGGYNPPPPPPQ